MLLVAATFAAPAAADLVAQFEKSHDLGTSKHARDDRGVRDLASADGGGPDIGCEYPAPGGSAEDGEAGARDGSCWGGGGSPDVSFSCKGETSGYYKSTVTGPSGTSSKAIAVLDRDGGVEDAGEMESPSGTYTYRVVSGTLQCKGPTGGFNDMQQKSCPDGAAPVGESMGSHPATTPKPTL